MGGVLVDAAVIVSDREACACARWSIGYLVSDEIWEEGEMCRSKSRNLRDELEVVE